MGCTEFDLDPAAPEEPLADWVPARRRITQREDGLRSSWGGRVWLNPPYGTSTGKWLRKFVEHGSGIALVFSRTDTRWFQETVPRVGGVLFLPWRIRFWTPTQPKPRKSRQGKRPAYQIVSYHDGRIWNWTPGIGEVCFVDVRPTLKGWATGLVGPRLESRDFPGDSPEPGGLRYYIPDGPGCGSALLAIGDWAVDVLKELPGLHLVVPARRI